MQAPMSKSGADRWKKAPLLKLIVLILSKRKCWRKAARVNVPYWPI